MAERTDTVIIGAGQAGLAASYYLTREGREHIILERGPTLAPAWEDRWDSFTLVTPNRMLQLPDFPYQGDEPGGFATRDEVVQYIEDFAATFDPPVRHNVEATSVEANPDGEGYLVHTDDGTLQASNVIVAVGTFQTPRIPAASEDISEQIAQFHSSQYRNPESLPEGAVLVVGAGQSGSQIAEELYQSGRRVYLSVSAVDRLPRRYRGKDFTEWLPKLGVTEQTVDQLPSPAGRFKPNPRVSGRDGGHTLNLHRFACEDVMLLGHLEEAEGTTVRLAPDLHQSLEQADKAAAQFKKGVDKYIAKADLDAPPPPGEPPPRDGYDVDVVRELDLEEEGISTIIWATGYTHDYRWVDLPLLDDYGYPRQQRGVTDYPGLYFVGLHWLHTIESGLLVGVGRDAEHVVEHLVERRY